MSAKLALAPAAWQVRELISIRYAVLWPMVRARVAARFERADRAERLRFLAAAGAEGRYLVLQDSFDPQWRVEVDGRVTFTSRPIVLHICLIVSGLAALTLAAIAVRDPRLT